MALEDLTGVDKFVDKFINSNPVDFTDTVRSMSGHLRGIKNVLINCFANVTGSVTASHVELNKLTGQHGGFLLSGVGVAGGDGSSITCAFSPTITELKDGMVLIVESVTPSTVAAPTFSPDGLAPYPVVKHANQPLGSGNIGGAGFNMILRFSLANSLWSLLNPLEDVTTVIPVGQKMLFQSTAAPVGWVKLITSHNAMLRITTGVAGVGGVKDFTFVFKEDYISDGHVLTLSELASHHHLTYNSAFNNVGGQPEEQGGYLSYSVSDGSLFNPARLTTPQPVGENIVTVEGEDDPHTHGLTLDVKYVDFIICEKQ